jgi:hypothetical protein
MKEPGLLMVLALLHAPIHRPSWNKNSPKFAFWGFSEVHQERFKNHSFGGCARTSPSANIRSSVDAHLKAAGIVASSMDTPIEVLRGKEMVINM